MTPLPTLMDFSGHLNFYSIKTLSKRENREKKRNHLRNMMMMKYQKKIPLTHDGSP
jgi:hypothetical protein